MQCERPQEKPAKFDEGVRGGKKPHSLSRVSVTKSASLQPEVPREEAASVGATAITISPLEI